MPDRDLYAAIAAAQAELVQPTKAGVNPHYKSVYLELPDVHEAAKVYARHGVATVSELATVDGVRVYRCALRLGTDQTPWCEFPVVGASAKPQEVGSALTYARRYALCALYGIAGDKDDDGEAAAGRQTETSTTGRTAEKTPALREPNRSPEGQTPSKTAQKSEQAKPAPMPEWVRKDAKLAAHLASRPFDSDILSGIAGTFIRDTVVPSENGASSHAVERTESGSWTCGCQGFGAHKSCRHCAVAELTHRADVLGDKWMMSVATFPALKSDELKALLTETAEMRAALAPNAGPWAWNGSAK